MFFWLKPNLNFWIQILKKIALRLIRFEKLVIMKCIIYFLKPLAVLFFWSLIYFVIFLDIIYRHFLMENLENNNLYSIFAAGS